MGILRSILTPAPDEIDAVRQALNARATSEPVVREQRALLSDPIPAWASKLDDTTEISEATLDELEHAISVRLSLLQSYPDGARRNRAIERHEEAARQVASWRDELSGVPASAGDAGDRALSAI